MFACLFGGSLRLADLARQFSPLVESIDERTVVFSIAGLGRLIGDERQIASEISRRGHQMKLVAHLAIASNPSAAILAARHLPGVTIIARGGEAEALDALPVDALPTTPEILATLRQWGVATFGELAALPEDGLVERLGKAGGNLRRMALGQGGTFVRVEREREEFTLRQDLDYPIEVLEPLLFLISAQLHDLTRRIQQAGEAVRSITLVLEHERDEFQRRVELPFPMREPAALLKQIQLSLEASPPQAPTVAVVVTLELADVRVSQGGLFQAFAPEPERLQTLLSRLKALVGEDRVGSPELLNTHRPDSYRLRPCVFKPTEPNDAEVPRWQLAVRYYRPPVPAQVTIQHGRVERISSAHASGAVLLSSGPWRSSGDWWTENPWSRDEWDVVLVDQSLYRIARASRHWFVDGSYD